MNIPWLTVTMLVPMVGAVVVMALPRTDGSELAKRFALGASLATLVVSLGIAAGFSPEGDRYQFTELTDWIPVFGAHYSLGLDGIGLTLLLLTTVLTPIVILASWHDADPSAGSGRAPRYSVNAFFAWMLALEGLAIGVFCATDVLLFYVLFEATLIPVYFLIGGWGGLNRSYASVKFLGYNLFGGLCMLAAVVGLYAESAKSPGGPTYLLSDLSNLSMSTTVERWLFVGFFIAFAIKAPLFPVHTWLPDAAAEATPGTQVLMVSVLDKIGTFGMLRFCLGLFPNAADWATPVVLVLAVVSVVYGALLAIGQNNISRLIAYTSVSHFGFIVLGIFVFNSLGQSGSTLYMFNHGLSTAALFLIAGFLVKRRGSADISDFGGVEKAAPILAGTFLVAGLSTLSLPGLSPFVSEFMVLAGAFEHEKWLSIVSVSAIVLAALYILLMYQRTMTGPVKPGNEAVSELNLREIAVAAPLIALIMFFGFYPKPMLDAINPAVEATLEHVGKQDPAPTVPASAHEETPK